jgi:electron transfer flavoprotein alpha/beta subunit
VRKRVEYKLAATPMEVKGLLAKWPEFETEEKLDAYLSERNLKIPVWTADDLGADMNRLGLAGSPTQVYKVNYVVLETTESKEVTANAEGIAALIQELVKEYIVG